MDAVKSEIPLFDKKTDLAVLVLSTSLEAIKEVFAGICDLLRAYQEELQESLAWNLLQAGVVCESQTVETLKEIKSRRGRTGHPLNESIQAQVRDSGQLDKALDTFRRVLKRAIKAREHSWVNIWRYAPEPVWYCTEMLKALPAIGPTETTIQDYENAVAGFLQQLRVLIPARWFEQMEACRRSGQQVISDQDATPKDRTEETALRRPKDPSTGNKSNPAKRRARAPSTGVRQGVVGDVVKASVSERSAPAGAIAQ